MEQDSLVQQNPTPKINNEDGQVAVEFILTFAFAIGVSFLFLSQSLNMCLGYLAHYATFMASRTYLVYDTGSINGATSISSAKARGRNTFETYRLDAFGLDTSTLKFNDPPPAGSVKNAFSGATYFFKKRISPFALVGGTREATFYTESLLGKEPLRSSCYEMTCKAVGQNACDPNMDITLFDNGC